MELRRLLRLSFLAGLETDEQRPTRGKLYLPSPREPKTTAVFSFAEPPKPIDSPKDIARLCPTLITDDGALMVAEYEKRLVCTGIAYLDDQHADYKLLDLPRDWTGRRGGLLVSLLAPGEIRMRHGYLCDYTLRGDAIQGRSPVATIEPVKTWLRELQSNLLFRLRDGRGKSHFTTPFRRRHRGIQRSSLSNSQHGHATSPWWDHCSRTKPTEPTDYHQARNSLATSHGNRRSILPHMG